MIKCGYIHNDIMSFYLLVDCDDPFVKYFCTFLCDDDHFGLWHLISYRAPCFHIYHMETLGLSVIFIVCILLVLRFGIGLYVVSFGVDYLEHH